MGGTQVFTLYHHGSSVCAAKVRFAMAEKNLAWTGVYIDILKGDQFTLEYMKLNPKAVVPTLVHDDKVIRESTVICEYLDLLHPETSLHPKDPLQFIEARYWTKAVDEDLHPACAALTFIASHRHTIAKLGRDGQEKFLSSTPAQSVTPDWKDQKRLWVEMGFDAPGAAAKIQLYDLYLAKMEKSLAQSPWLVGDALSIADVAMSPYVNRLAALSMSGMWENGRLPNVERWFKQIRARPAFEPSFVAWMPESLTADLRDNGAKSWPDVARIIGVED
ncbi:MAG: glutathione S-transferase family protein [Hyphomicrobiaceae bacterium]